MGDTFQAYRRRRTEIARTNRLTELKHLSSEGWRTATTTLSTDLHTDHGGMLLLEKFARAAQRYQGGCYADDGESIAVWAVARPEVTALIQAHGEQLRARIGSRALFHPGYLPLATHADWPCLRIQNPNPSPYQTGRSGEIDWLWCLNIKPGLDSSALEQYDFFVGERSDDGSQIGITAGVTLSAQNYKLEQPTVTTRRQLERVLADANQYVAKLKQVRARYEQAGLATTSYLELPDRHTTEQKLWRLR